MWTHGGGGGTTALQRGRWGRWGVSSNGGWVDCGRGEGSGGWSARAQWRHNARHFAHCGRVMGVAVLGGVGWLGGAGGGVRSVGGAHGRVTGLGMGVGHGGGDGSPGPPVAHLHDGRLAVLRLRTFLGLPKLQQRGGGAPGPHRWRQRRMAFIRGCGCGGGGRARAEAATCGRAGVGGGGVGTPQEKVAPNAKQGTHNICSMRSI